MSNHVFADINFNVQSNVTQRLAFDPDVYSATEIIDGLQEGKYLTTVDFSKTDEGVSESVCYFDDTGNEVTVAVIVEQAFHEPEYTDFQLLEV